MPPGTAYVYCGPGAGFRSALSAEQSLREALLPAVRVRQRGWHGGAQRVGASCASASSLPLFRGGRRAGAGGRPWLKRLGPSSLSRVLQLQHTPEELHQSSMRRWSA